MSLQTGVSPHIRTENDTKNIMLDLIIALSPATLFGIIIFGIGALLVVAVCVATAVLSEALTCYTLKKPLSTGDLTAVVTGLLLALCLPSETPLYIAAIGSAFSILVAKMLFGGVGKNLVNPAIAGRVFLLVAFPAALTAFKSPFTDLTASATPLSGGQYSFNEIFYGVLPGTIGETSVVLLALGGAYLLIRKVITLTIPLSFILSAVAVGLLSGQDALLTLSSGGLVLGAVFMATDYVTSPMTFPGKVVFGAGCGIITMVIRLFASLPEGVSYAILIMNILVPFIDNLFAPKPFGTNKNQDWRTFEKCLKFLKQIKASIFK